MSCVTNEEEESRGERRSVVRAETAHHAPSMFTVKLNVWGGHEMPCDAKLEAWQNEYVRRRGTITCTVQQTERR